MVDFNEDDELARAIAASLSESHNGRASAHTEGDGEAEFEADLRAALAASQAQTQAPQRSSSPATSTSSLSQPMHQPPPARALAHSEQEEQLDSSNPLAAFRNERKRMEEERIARQKRRRADAGEPEEPEDRRPVKRMTPSDSSSASSSRERPAAQPRPQPKGKSKDASAELYLDGEVRQTANMHVRPGENGENGKSIFTLTDIIGDKSQIEFAILSSYAVEPAWINSFFMRETPVIIVGQPEGAQSQAPTAKLNIMPNWVRVTPFFRSDFGIMHIKLLLLFYKGGRLRIVVPTANLIRHDWSQIENTVFAQDVYRREKPIVHDKSANDFATALESTLKALNVGAGINAHLKNDHPSIPLQNVDPGCLRMHWDFSRVTAALVPSIHGKHEGWPQVIKTGHTALMRVVRTLAGIEPKNKGGLTGSLEYQGSSLGKYSSKWLNEFYGSAMGQNPESWLHESTARRSKLPLPSIKIVFPTHDYVKQSTLGEPGGGTIFCKKSFWEGSTFPRQLFYQSRSTRGPVLLHSKMAIALFAGSTSAEDDSDDEIVVLDSKTKQPAKKNTVAGWVYVGSHNFTPSAWGTLSGTPFTPILNITNYELGVVLPLKSRADASKYACYERPLKKYQSSELPWMQEMSVYHQAGAL